LAQWSLFVVLSCQNPLAEEGCFADDFKVGDPIPQQVLDDWQARRDECLGLHWKVRLTEVMPAGYLDEPVPKAAQARNPPVDTPRLRDHEAWLDFVGNRSRVSQQVLARDDQSPTSAAVRGTSDRLVVFDSARLISLVETSDSKPAAPIRATLHDLGKTRHYKGFELAFHPGLWVAGIVSLGSKEPNYDNWPYQAETDGVRIQSIEKRDAHTILVLREVHPVRKHAYNEIEIDIDRRSLVLSYAMYSGGSLWRKVEVDWVPDGDDWRPDTWTDNLQFRPGTSGRARLVEFDRNPRFEDSLFELNLPAGELYLDEASDKKKPWPPPRAVEVP